MDSFFYIDRASLDEQWYAELHRKTATFYPALQSWYLDAASDKQWVFLCHTSKEYGIPLVFNKKIPGYPQVFMPRGLQQLAVIGNSPETFNLDAIISVIQSRFKKGILRGSLDLFQTEGPSDIVKRSNYILDLSQDYSFYNTSYDSEHRRRLRKANTQLQCHQSTDVDAFFSFYEQELESIVQHGREGYKRLRHLAQVAFQQGQGLILTARDADDHLLAAGFWIVHDKGVLFQHLVSSRAGKKVYASHFLIDQMIALSCKTERVFDFEGSDIEGVARLFRHFKPQKVEYAEWQYNRIPKGYMRLLRWFKTFRK